MDSGREREHLHLSVQEVGIQNDSTSSSDNGSVSGAEDGTTASMGSGFHDSSSRERRERSRSAHTALMEEDNYHNLQTSTSEDSFGTNSPPHDSLWEFDDITELSKGSFGQVVKGRKKMEDKCYAIKIVPQREMDEERLIREVKALAHLEHPNIVRYYTAWWGEYEVNILGDSEEINVASYDRWECDGSSSEQSRRIEPCLFIQMELCKMSLKGWIWKRNEDPTQNVNKDRSLQIFSQVIAGVDYIHSKNFIHRDLKPENIFLMEDMTVKTGDFGLVTRLAEENESQQQQRTLGVGTKSYMAPEQNGDHYGSEVDIFASGLILFELLWKFGTECEKVNTWNNIRAGDLPTDFITDFPDEAREIMKMLSGDPKMRPSAGDLKEAFLKQEEYKAGQYLSPSLKKSSRSSSTHKILQTLISVIWVPPAAWIIFMMHLGGRGHLKAFNEEVADVWQKMGCFKETLWCFRKCLIHQRKRMSIEESHRLSYGLFRKYYRIDFKEEEDI